MPRHILIQIINQRLIFNFIAILIVYFASFWVNYSLIFQILGIKVNPRKILLAIIPNILYAVFAKQIFPEIIYILIYLILLSILAKAIIGRTVAVSWMRVIWSSFLIEFIVGIGMLFVQPIIMLIPAIARVITTPIGIVYGTICESIFPLILWFLLKTVNVSIIPPIKSVQQRIDPLDLGKLYIFIVPFLWLYQLSIKTFKGLETIPKIDLMDLFYQLFLTGSLFITCYWVYTTTNRRREEERQRFERTIKELETHNSEITKLNENLKTLKMEPMKLVNNFETVITNGISIIGEIKDYYKKLETSGYIVIQPDKLLEYNLNDNEKAVLEGIMAGKTFQEISEDLNFVEGTVKNIASQIYKKFGVKNRKELEEFVLKNLL